MASPGPDSYSKSQVTSDTERLVKNWLEAQEELRTAITNQQRKTTELHQAAEALAKFLLPADVKPGEKIGIWYGDSLILAEQTEAGEYNCRVRTCGRAIAQGG